MAIRKLEQAVLEEIPIETQNAILFESEKPEIVVLALGRNAELRKQLAEATNPSSNWSSAGTYRIECQNHAKSKTTAATTPTVKGKRRSNQ